MDKNQILGIVIIVVILISYSVYMMPSDEEQAEKNRKRDSVALVIQKREIADSLDRIKIDSIKEAAKNTPDTVSYADSLITDSLKTDNIRDKYGIFAPSGDGEEKMITLINDKIKLKISTLGGFPKYCELLEYKTHDSLPLILFEGDENNADLNFYLGNRVIDSETMFFTPQRDDTLYNAVGNSQTLALRMNAGPGKYIEYSYTMEPGSYLVKFDIKIVGLQNDIAQQQGYLDFFWNASLRRQEKGTDWENQNSTIYYKHFEAEVDYLGETKDDAKEKISTQLKWVAYKDQFFTSALIAHDYFLSGNVKYTKDELQDKYLKYFKTRLSIPYDKKANEKISFSYYYGPNKYKLLQDISVTKDDDLSMQNLVPLGWGVFGWVNRFAIIPLFNWLEGHIASFGLIILLMTLIIKLTLFPLTYKSYKSSAKMRVLKPQIDEINAKIPKEKQMDRQKKTMELYRKVGVNPMGGCLPMLLQMPILIAMFRFFPASIELRQKSFLWATDLSAYDSIWDFPGGFSIPFYGDHVSLFTLLMAAAIVVSTILNPQQMNSSNSSMPGMKLMMYMMPVMMLFWFNNYSAGLSYYYFLSNLVTIGQTLAIRKMVDEDKILSQLNAKKAKPKKKSRFQDKLETIQKQQKLATSKNIKKRKK